MQFYAISILLHRPFFSRRLNFLDYSNDPEYKHPRTICITAAQSIVKLLRIYRKQHTLRRTNVHIVHLVFTASLICIYNNYSNDKVSGTNGFNDLQFCCQALGEIGEAYQNSMRALEVVICLKREWLGKARNLSRLKRPSSSYHNESRKRRPTESSDHGAGILGSTSKLPAKGTEEPGLQAADGISESPDQFLGHFFQAMSDPYQSGSGAAGYGNLH